MPEPKSTRSKRSKRRSRSKRILDNILDNIPDNVMMDYINRNEPNSNSKKKLDSITRKSPLEDSSNTIGGRKRKTSKRKHRKTKR